jgi:hypothetical protein
MAARIAQPRAALVLFALLSAVLSPLAIASTAAAGPTKTKPAAPVEVEDTGGCNKANLIKKATLTGIGLTQGRSQLLQDGVFPTEGITNEFVRTNTRS